MILEQSSTLDPLVRHLCTFFEVAGGTRQDNIAHIIAPSTGQGDDVFDVVSSQFLMAIITSGLLSSTLLLDFLKSMSPYTCQLPGASAVFFDPGHLVPLFGHGVLSFPATDNFRVSLFECPLMSKDLLAALLVSFLPVSLIVPTLIASLPHVSPLRRVQAMNLVISGIGAASTDGMQAKAAQRIPYKKFRCGWLGYAASPAHHPLWRLLWGAFFCILIGIQLPLVLTRFAIDSQPISARLQCIEMVCGFWIILLTSWASFMPIWRNIARFSINLLAGLTPRMQSIFCGLVSEEKFKRGGEVLLAFTALFHWGVGMLIHDLNSLSFSALSSCCQSGKATTFSSGLITPSLGNMSIVAFFFPCSELESEKNFGRFLGF